MKYINKHNNTFISNVNYFNFYYFQLSEIAISSHVCMLYLSIIMFRFKNIIVFIEHGIAYIFFISFGT